jgi:hypothetical protein
VRERMTTIIALVTVILIFGQGGQCGGAGPPQLSEAEIDSKLFALKPLPKVHYYWWLPVGFLEDRENRRLYELARITHSLCVSGEWTKEQQIDNYVYICARVNKTKPAIKASLGINFSPWHRRFDKKLPPTDRGPTYWKEIAYFEERARLVEKWIEDSNKKYHSDVKVGAIILDCERFVTKKDDKAWNEGMREALDAIHLKAQSVFPDSRIEWYGRGITRAPSGDGWVKTGYWTGKEIMPSLSCSLYSLPEIECMRETFRRTCKLADESHVQDVTPYVALAAGYRRGLTKYHYFANNWSYDIIYSYKFGAELNIKWYSDRPEWFAPYSRAKVIYFYPRPFNTHTPDWARHFIAYVRGATRVQDLKDLGYEE